MKQIVSPLKLQTVAERAGDYCRDSYLFLGNVIKGVALAAATYAGLKIFADWRTNLPQVVLFVCSFFPLIVSYMTWGRGVLLTNARSNILDTVFPLWMGVMEFSLFGVITPDDKHPNAWHWWFVIFGLHALGAVALVLNRIQLTNPKLDFESALNDLAEEYIGWMRANVIGASVGVVLSFVFWWATERCSWINATRTGHDLVYSVLALLSAVALLKPIRDAEKERRRIAEFVAINLRGSQS